MRRGLILPAVLAALLAGACFGGDDGPEAPPSAATGTSVSEATPAATATPEPSVTQVPSPTPRPRPEANPFPPDLRQRVDGLLAEVVALRGIPLREPVDMFLLTREQARDFYDTPDDEEQAPAATSVPGPTATPGPRPLDPRQELYELLGLMPPFVEGAGTPDVQEQELDNLISIITGFYDHSYRAFYMIEDISGGIHGPLAIATIVHELTHALQFQEVDLNAEGAQRAGNFDATTALLAMIEGEAVHTELEVLGYSNRTTYFRQPVCGTIPAPRGLGSPYAIERELDVWYEEGLCFFQAIVAQDPTAIARVFSDIPSTMEQVLHPEKYLAGEQALLVEPATLDTALGAGWSKLSEGVFGEFGLQNILLNGLSAARQMVQTAAAGWGGDAWDLYVSGHSRFLHLETVWDTPTEAPEFAEALAASLSNLGFAATEVSPITTALTRDGVTWSISQRHDRVTVLVANDGAALEAAQEALGLP